MIKDSGLNECGRDFVVGDLNGCYSLLMRALDSVKFDISKDRLISLGDLIDRGDESQRCLSLLDEPWFLAIKGNHEAMFAKVLESEEHLNHFIKSGGSWLLDADTTGFEGFSGWYSHWAKKVDALPTVGQIRLMDGAQIGLVHGECLQSRWDSICLHDEGLLVGSVALSSSP
jgi:serine/threonine protein phosphatase 1